MTYRLLQAIPIGENMILVHAKTDAPVGPLAGKEFFYCNASGHSGGSCQENKGVS